MKMAAWLIVQSLLCTLMSNGDRRTHREGTVESFTIAGGTDHKHAGAHRHDSIDASTNEAGGYAAEDVVRGALCALASIEHCKLHTALLQYIRQIVRADQCQFAFFILECQQALSFPLQAMFNR